MDVITYACWDYSYTMLIKGALWVFFFSKVVATFNHVAGSFNISSATTGDVLIIASFWIYDYRKTSNIRRTLGGNKIVDHSDVVGASHVSAAPTTSSFST